MRRAWSAHSWERRNRSDRQGVRPLGRVRRGLQLPASSRAPMPMLQASKDCPAPIKAMPIVTRHDHGSGEASKAPKSWQAAPARAVACQGTSANPARTAQTITRCSKAMLGGQCRSQMAGCPRRVALGDILPGLERQPYDRSGLGLGRSDGSARERRIGGGTLSAGGLSPALPCPPPAANRARKLDCATHTFSRGPAAADRPSLCRSVKKRAGPMNRPQCWAVPPLMGTAVDGQG